MGPTIWNDLPDNLRMIQNVETFRKKLKTYLCTKYKNVFAQGTLGSLPDTYLVPVNYILGVGVWHIDAL